jgi:RNA polymerase sigma factor (sigma-70 family)
VTDIGAISETRRVEYERVVAPVLGRVHRGLIVRFGIEVGSDVFAEVNAWAWEHVDHVVHVANPAGYLFRVGQSAARRHHRWQRDRHPFPASPRWIADVAPELDDDLLAALRKLKPPQRVAVLLVHGYSYTYREVAELLRISEAAVTNHIHRGLAELRHLLQDDR